MILSIVMIVKDEEKNIRRTLSSLKSINNFISTELIILDTGSKDNTVKIARDFTEHVYFSKWNQNFSDMRNKSIRYAKGEWILILD
ncbi:glycosyltransferase, partial [Clostridium cadaveris]